MAKVRNVYKLQYEKEIEEDVFVDREVRIRFTMNTLAELEEALGAKIPQIGEMITKGGIGIKECITILWAGMLHKNPEVSMREAGDIMTGAGFKETMAVVLPALVETINGGKLPEEAPAEVKEDAEPSKN